VHTQPANYYGFDSRKGTNQQEQTDQFRSIDGHPITIGRQLYYGISVILS
jgi:hypothetical protein